MPGFNVLRPPHLTGPNSLAEILPEEEMAKPSLRFSFSHYNGREELDYTVGVLKEFVESQVGKAV